MTRDEMLALLADNTSGDISAADLRAIVADLYDVAHTRSQSYSYQWSTSGTAPATGNVTTDQPWSATATALLMSETTDDGLAVGFGLLNASAQARIQLRTATGSTLEATVNGPSSDLGTYRQVPITVTAVVGPQPANNAAITVTVITYVPQATQT